MVKISELKRFDMADHLDSEEAIADYLSIVLEEDDPESFIQALGTVARARSMKEIAEKTGLNRESLYKALSGDTSPRYETIVKVINAMGLKLAIVPQTRHWIDKTWPCARQVLFLSYSGQITNKRPELKPAYAGFVVV